MSSSPPFRARAEGAASAAVHFSPQLCPTAATGRWAIILSNTSGLIVAFAMRLPCRLHRFIGRRHVSSSANTLLQPARAGQEAKHLRSRQPASATGPVGEKYWRPAAASPAIFVIHSPPLGQHKRGGSLNQPAGCRAASGTALEAAPADIDPGQGAMAVLRFVGRRRPAGTTGVSGASWWRSSGRPGPAPAPARGDCAMVRFLSQAAGAAAGISRIFLDGTCPGRLQLQPIAAARSVPSHAGDRLLCPASARLLPDPPCKTGDVPPWALSRIPVRFCEGERHGDERCPEPP
jgi:hypothetical protein